MRIHILLRGSRRDEANDAGAALLAAALRARNADVSIAEFRSVSDPAIAAPAAGDIVLIRSYLRSEEDLARTADAVETLEKRGVRCMPGAEGLVAAEDRLRTFVRLRVAGVATPPLVAVCVAREGAANVARLHGRLNAFPVIVRSRVGPGAVPCADVQALEAELERRHGLLPEDAVLLQPLLQHREERTVIVARARVRSVWRRVTSGAPSPANEAAYASASLHALAAAEACRLDVARVDFVITDSGPICVRVAAIPPLDPAFEEDRDFADGLADASVRAASR